MHSTKLPRANGAHALAALVVAIACQPAVARACGVEDVSAAFVAGRAFATPVTAADRHTLHLWIDSDGGGFIFQDVAERYGTLSVTPQDRPARARLPHLVQTGAFPGLTSKDGTLPVMRRADVAGDPIFAGIDGQLGTSWLQNRIWTFDYPRGTLTWRCDGSDPHHPAAEEIALSFQTDARGGLLGGMEYPQAVARVAGEPLLASLDTAATVALSQRGVAAMHAQGQAVRATSFVTHALAGRWHSEHPQWRFVADAGQQKGIDAILVPSLSAGRVRFDNVWFTTRPGDDVFQGERETLKLGPTAFGCCALTIDYPRRTAIVHRSSPT